jgi:putative transposase
MKAEFTIALMCRCLRVSRAGYYAWVARPESARSVQDRSLNVHIRAVHEESRGSYGSPRVHFELQCKGIKVGRHRVARLMRAGRIRARKKRRYVATTQSNHEFPVAPNLLARRFDVAAPNTVWAGDITYLATAEGWLYLAVVLDLCSRRVIGWAMGARIDRGLALSALEMATSNRPTKGVMYHSDRGVQYASTDYREALVAAGMTCSMSRSGDCWDNAMVESFFSTLKTELVGADVFPSREIARSVVFEWIESFYNRRRRHSALGYMAPEEYELKAAA